MRFRNIWCVNPSMRKNGKYNGVLGGSDAAETADVSRPSKKNMGGRSDCYQPL